MTGEAPEPSLLRTKKIIYRQKNIRTDFFFLCSFVLLSKVEL